MLIRHLTTVLHEGPDRRRSGVEDRDAVLLNQLPERTRLRGSWGSLVHDGGRTIRQGSVDDVAVSGDPAHVSGAPVDVILTNIEDPLEGEVGPEVVAGCAVHHTLGLAGGTRCVEHEKTIFTSHRLGRAIAALPIDQLMPPKVAAIDHLNRLLGALHHQHRLNRRTSTIRQRRIDSWLE